VDESDHFAAWKKHRTMKEMDKHREGQIIPDVELSPGIKSTIVLVIHPSLRHLSIKNRWYKNEFTGDDAEIELLKDAYNRT